MRMKCVWTFDQGYVVALVLTIIRHLFHSQLYVWVRAFWLFFFISYIVFDSLWCFYASSTLTKWLGQIMTKCVCIQYDNNSNHPSTCSCLLIQNLNQANHIVAQNISAAVRSCHHSFRSMYVFVCVWVVCVSILFIIYCVFVTAIHPICVMAVNVYRNCTYALHGQKTYRSYNTPDPACVWVCVYAVDTCSAELI